MNFSKKHLLPITLAALTGWSSLLLADSKPTPPSATVKDPSVFVMPTSSSQGRDPFFPESTRVYDQMNAAAHTNQVVELPPLTVLGISGTPGHLLAIINNHTFAKDDDGYVLTPAGDRVHIRCIEVDQDHVIVEFNGQKHRINMGKP